MVLVDKLTIGRFRLEKDRFVVEEYEDMVLHSNTSKILARGTIGFDGRLDLLINPEFFKTPSWLPLEYVDIFKLKLTGTLDNPRVALPIGNPFSKGN